MAVFGILMLVPGLLLAGLVILVVYRFVQFWIGFAQGINEGGTEPRGFEVKQTTGDESPVPAEKEHDHG